MIMQTMAKRTCILGGREAEWPEELKRHKCKHNQEENTAAIPMDTKTSYATVEPSIGLA
jgi:hypothetical protein